MSKNRITIGSRAFEHDDIKSGSCYQTVSLLSEALEINYLEVDVQSADNLKNLPQDTPLTYFYDEKQVGIFYIQTVKRTGPTTYSIYAISTIGLLDKSDHYGGIYTGQTADEIIADICGSVPYIIKSNLKDSRLYGWLPIASRRDNLAQVLFALGAALKTDLDGVLRIEGLWSGLSGSIGKDRMYSNGNVDYGDLITGVSVTEHQYAEGGESAKLFEGTTQQGDIITFDEPAYSLTASGFTILESGANYAKVSSGSGILTGSMYVHLTREITRSISQAGTPNVKTVKDATLVSLVNSSAVADRLKSYYKCREIIENDFLYLGERGGDVAKIYHPYDKVSVPACLQEIDVNLSNTLAAKEKSLVGYTPDQTDAIEIFDEQEVVLSSKQWVVPDGVTHVRAALIGGGDGGGAGFNGKDGGYGSGVNISSGSTGTKSGSGGNGGGGGQAGVPGSGGKVNIIDIEVVPGEVIEINIGAGGEGGVEDGTPGAPGKDTSIARGGDIFTSAEGAASVGGYIDVVTGRTYATPGEFGRAGADGGSGATDGQAAESGGAVLGYTGGSAGTGNLNTRKVSGLNYTPSVSQSWSSQTSLGSVAGTSRSGNASYSVNPTTGITSRTGSVISVGYYLSKVVEGKIYPDVSNDPVPNVPSSATTVKAYSSVTEIECKILGTNMAYFYRRVLTVTRSYQSYLVNISEGTYSGGGGGAANGNGGASATTAGGGGANAVAPSNANTPGNGGSAGHGGGGGGGGGGGYVSVTGTPGNLSYSASGAGRSGGLAGKGSAGGRGANGAVILYFGVPHKIKSGHVITSDKKFLIDGNKRRFVV